MLPKIILILLAFFYRFWRGLGKVLESKMEAQSITNGVEIEVETSIDVYVVFFRC